MEFTYHSYVIDSRDASDKKVNLDPHRSVCLSTMAKKNKRNQDYNLITRLVTEMFL